MAGTTGVGRSPWMLARCLAGTDAALWSSAEHVELMLPRMSLRMFSAGRNMDHHLTRDVFVSSCLVYDFWFQCHVLLQLLMSLFLQQTNSLHPTGSMRCEKFSQGPWQVTTTHCHPAAQRYCKKRAWRGRRWLIIEARKVIWLRLSFVFYKTDAHNFILDAQNCYESWRHEKCFCKPANNSAADVSMGLEEELTTTVGCLPSCVCPICLALRGTLKTHLISLFWQGVWFDTSGS